MISEQKGIRIWIFRNGDVHGPGKRMVISTRVYKNYEQFLHQTSRDLNLLHGAVRKVVTLEGGEVTSLKQLKDGHSYVGVSNGETFQKVEYKLPDEPGGSRLQAGTGLGGGVALLKLEGLRNFVKEVEEEKPLFSNTSKGYRVIVYLNGNDKTFDLKIVLNFRNCKSFERLLTTFSQIFQKRIRRIYDAQTYARIKSLHQLRDGHNLVVSTEHDPLVKCKYPEVNPLIAPQKLPEHQVPKVATFYINGDAYHRGYQLTVRRARFPSLSFLLEHLTNALDPVNGRATKLFRLDNGQRLEDSDLDPLFSVAPDAPTKFVIVSGDDVFFNIRYDVNAYQRLVFGGGGEPEPEPQPSTVTKPRTQHRVVKKGKARPAATTAVTPREPKSVRSKTPAVKSPAPASRAQTRPQTTTRPKTEQRPRTQPKSPHSHPTSAGIHGTAGGAVTFVSSEEEQVKEFATGEFKSRKSKLAGSKKKGQTIKYHDGTDVNTEDLPPLPMSLPVSPPSDSI